MLTFLALAMIIVFIYLLSKKILSLFAALRDEHQCLSAARIITEELLME